MKRWMGRKLAVVCIIVAFLFVTAGILLWQVKQTPDYYSPFICENEERVPKYLTNVLGPALYNGLQKKEAFDVVITEEGINEIIAWSKWPKTESQLSFLKPQVYFLKGRIAVAGTVLVNGAEIVVTAMGEAKFNGGQLRLPLVKVWAGKLNVGPLAKFVARQAYAQHVEDKGVKNDDIGTKVVRSLLFGEEFEPVFVIKKLFKEPAAVRILGVEIEEKKLSLRLEGG